MTARVTPTAATVVALVLVLMGGLFLFLRQQDPSGSSSSASDPVSITHYDATFVGTDGTLRATETIDAEFPYGRHGIFRYWDGPIRATLGPLPP